MTVFPSFKTIGIAAIFLSISALAQEPDPEVFNLFLESRIQKPADRATAQERKTEMRKLADIYLVTNLPRAIELSKNPRTSAEIEFRRRIVIFRAFTKDFLASNPASDQEIFNAYQDQIALTTQKEFKARHILVESQGEAVALIERLQGGADFIKLANEKSMDTSGATGGELDWFTAQMMVKPFSDAVAKLADGAVTATPVQTQFGWHVILREDSRDSAPPPLESVRDAVKLRVEGDKLRNFIDGLRDSNGE